MQQKSYPRCLEVLEWYLRNLYHAYMMNVLVLLKSSTIDGILKTVVGEERDEEGAEAAL
jgi:hypothetical protein